MFNLQDEDYQWKSRSAFFYFVASYAITGDVFIKVPDVADVYESKYFTVWNPVLSYLRLKAN